MQAYNNAQTLLITHGNNTTKLRSPRFVSLDAFYEFSDLVASWAGIHCMFCAVAICHCL